ncbi:Serine/threonine-protein phosphatase 4 regulatory subunit 3 [Halotydeus destructor]|nr:Serine/threonine-protein phosphatase 4 regulatory subunit 3 [Halotydeus destructor]
MTDTRRRVKLYALNAERQWDDRGTGHVSSSYVDRLKGMSLLVRAESDGSLLLESKIQTDTAYQKQQETLIVWSEGDNYDLALSFQEKAGCDEIWAKICQVQGKDPSVEITQEIVEEEEERFDDVPETSAFSVELPSCDAEKLEDINDLITSCVPFPFKREKLALALETESYIKKLLNLFRTCESDKNTKALHKLYEIFKNIFLLNKNPLFEVMLSEDSLFDVLGVFEYDPSLEKPKRHRDYLKSVSRFKEVIPFGNPELINKIHQTYRVQYIQDVVLPTPSVFEENMLSTLSSFIFFNKVEIVSLIQEDERFLRTLFAQITSSTTDNSKRRDLVLFLKEFCTFSQTLQPQNRDNFFKALSSLGVLQALEVILGMNDVHVKTAAVDILTYVVEYSPSMVREYALQQDSVMEDTDHLIVNVIIRQMVSDPDPELGMAVQLSSILRLLIDPENMMSSAMIAKTEKTDFLNFFYKRCMHSLLKPVLDETKTGSPSSEDSQSPQLLSLILELLSFCVEHHNYHIRNCIFQYELLRHILVLMKSRHTFLVLSALRFLRKIIGLKDEFYIRHIIAGNLLAPVSEALLKNKGRYNLLDSAIIELFEFIRAEEMKTLTVYLIEKFGEKLEGIDYVRTFKGLKAQYELFKEKLKEKNAHETSNSMIRSRYRRDEREVEEEEELWFQNDNEEVDDLDQPLGECYKLEPEFSEQMPSDKMKNKTLGISYSELEVPTKQFDLENGKLAQAVKGNNTRKPGLQVSQNTPRSDMQTARKGLVDYPDEDSDDEEMEDEEDGISSPASKRARLSTT